MNAKEEHIARILKIMFGIMLLSVILLLVFGELFMPRENPTGNGECIELNADWERVNPDGTREKIVVPGKYPAPRGEAFRLETVLPQDQDDTWYCMRASQQDMRVYVGDELRQEYCTEESRLFGKDSASAFVFFEIEDEDAGKVLAIEITSECEYSGFLNTIYVGDKGDIIRAQIRDCSSVVMVSFYMFILSSIVVIIGLMLKIVYKRSVDITYLAIGILQLSLAMIVESRIRQFFLPNSSVAESAGFMLNMLVPYPFMVYVNRIQKGRYEKIYRIISMCIAAYFIISIVLQVLGILHFADLLGVSYAFIIIMVIAVAVTICMDVARKRLREYREIVIGIIVMLAVSIWETYVIFVPESPYNGGFALSFGLIILLFVACIKAARDLLAIENEKKMAIAAGEAKAKFLANMSHEIRTPINTIIGMNEMILRENQDKAVEEYALSVQYASNLLLGLINDILDFSKIEAGKLDVLETEYNLSKMLDGVVKDIRIKAESKKLKLKTNIEEELPIILKGDEIRIRQILNNLLSNAVKYTKKGSITLTVRGERLQENFALHMSVEDTGMGIKQEDIDKLFSSFQRLEEKKNRYIEGTGLGLNITRQLVELMGGSIEVKSEYGKGSCFIVKIPQQIIEEASVAENHERYAEKTAVKDKKQLYAPTAEIIVVDDNEMNLKVVKALLKRTGIKLTLASGGMECLELCRHTKYDLILMDHMMPAPDGIETLHMLRKDNTSLNRDTKVIVVTANAIAGVAEGYLREGFADYLTKPIVAEDLEEMILKYLPEDKLETEKNSDSEENDFGKVEDERNKPAEESVEEKEEDAIYYIDKKIGLEYCCNDEDIYKEMVNTYCEQGEKYLRELPEYYKARDWKNYEIIVHSIKSTALLIGAAAFSEKAKQLEKAAVKSDEAILLAESEQFFEEYKTILEKLK